MSNVTTTPNPTSSLKPERIGLTAALVERSPLKPERIGQRLQKLPGWELTETAEAIWRSFRFHRTDTAQAFAAFVTRLADEHGQRPVAAQSWNAVTVTVPGEGQLTEAVLDFAERLMLLPEGFSTPVSTPEPETPVLAEVVPMPAAVSAGS